MPPPPPPLGTLRVRQAASHNASASQQAARGRCAAARDVDAAAATRFEGSGASSD